MSEDIDVNQTITNNFIFGKVMQEPKLCKLFLEKLLGIKIKKINYPEREKEIGILPESHDVRLDVYADDENNTFYNVEMQSYRETDLPKRSRYYQGILDVNYLEKGEDYDKLPESFIIFVCDYDVFGWDIPLLKYQYIDVEHIDKTLDDGTNKIFLCRTEHFEEADIDEDIKAFLRYMGGYLDNNSFIKEIDRKVKEIKNNEKWRRNEMAVRAEVWDARREGRRIGREEGRLEGIQEGRRQVQEEIIGIRQRAEKAEKKVSLLIDKLIEIGYPIDAEKLLG